MENHQKWTVQPVRLFKDKKNAIIITECAGEQSLIQNKRSDMMSAAKIDGQTVRYHNSIDLFKFIMAIVVIAIHTNPLESCTNRDLLKVYYFVTELAVPFFFLASGFLLAEKMNWPYANNTDNANRLLKYLLKIIKMYLIWTAVYLPLAVYHFISSGTSPINAILLYLRGFFFIGEQYNSWPLWYLLSTIYALLAIYILLYGIKKSTTVSLILLSVIASFFSIGFSALVAYEGEMPTVLQGIKKLVGYSIVNGRILRGMIYIPVGMLLADKQISFIVNLFVLILGVVANYFVSNSIIFSYAVIFISIALFGIVKEIKLKNNDIYPKLRSMSISMYLTHMYIWTFYYTLVYKEKTFGWDCFLVTLVITTALSLVVKYAKNSTIISRAG